MRFFFLAIVSASLTVAATAGAESPRVLGNFQDWSAYVFEDGQAKICYLHAEPKEAKGDYTRRGPTFAQVSHRPSENVTSEVSITAGYTYREGSEVEVEIGEHSYKLFTDQDSAWPRDSATDSELVAAMRRGREMVVRGTSTRGTLTTDTYSLLGFTRAYQAISEACGVR